MKYLARAHIVATSIRLALALAVGASLYLPHMLHFMVDSRPPEASAYLQGTTLPSAATLEEVAAMRFAVELPSAHGDPLATARKILDGTLAAPEYLAHELRLQGYPEDFRQGPSTFQLIMASLETEAILLTAYEQTSDSRFLALAVRRIRQFAEWESSTWASSDFLWNDHAVAARIGVLARLWRHVRGTDAASGDLPMVLWSLVNRSGQLLAAPSHFTVRTNHGVMQNVALLQIGAAFPSLPSASRWRALAMERLLLQLRFYVSVEGAVLEHSPEYHALGGELLAMAVRLAAMNEIAVPPSLLVAVHATQGLLADLVRPDGTLPLIGNTSSRKLAGFMTAPSDGAVPLVVEPLNSRHQQSALLPLSGYAIWWSAGADDERSQTVITWAKHDGHGHKHADETSLTLWSHGSDWLTNVGYWPYGMPGLEAAYSWSGSNAPHQLGEPTSSNRSTRLLSEAQSPDLKAIETIRRADNGASFRRQIVQRGADSLLVLDDMVSPTTGVELAWTTGAGLDLEAVAPRSYVGRPNSTGHRLSLTLVSQPAASVQLLRGSHDPFGGWVVRDGKPTATTAVHVRGNSGHSLVVTLARVGTLGPETHLTLAEGASAERWSVDIDRAGGRERVTRDGDRIDWLRSGQLAQLKLAVPADVSSASLALKASYRAAVESYPPWRDLSRYRARAILALLLAAVAIEVLWQLVAHRVSQRAARVYHVVVLAGWIAIAAYAHLVYLV